MADPTGDAATRASTLPGAETAVGGRYRLRGRLGRGASKEVYLAYDERLDREVAFALVVGAVDPVSRARVVREARLTGRLGDHPNVVTVYDTGELDGTPFLVLRAMPGGSLAEALGAGPLTVTRAIRVARDVATALAHAHAHAVLHRDVKPDNVWLAADGSAALGDFGIAHDTGAEHLTAEGVVLGTVRYVAPEQIRGEDATPASDLYALGVTLHELVTGRPPFTGGDATAVFAQHLAAAPLAPSAVTPDVPAALDRLVLALLAKDPAQRPSSAAEVAAALERLDTAAGSIARSDAGPATRRVVTVVAGRLGDGDPEAQRALLERCATLLERHGARVERHLGDALVGLFGSGAAHDDDPLRAARAAVALRVTAPELAIGVEAGEVLVSAGAAAAVTGAPIAAAGRLAERAGPGEVVLGAAIRPALADQARVERSSGRLLELHAARPALLREPATPFVGRAGDLARLETAFARARDERACHVVTVLGAPGLGKSRLAGEAVARRSAEAVVVACGCAPHGEGTAYLPLQELVRGLAGEDPRPRVEQLLAGDEQAVQGVLAAVGLADATTHVEETAWAMRRLLEAVARDRPVVVAVEDLHWAHDALLDVLDQVATFSGGAPILLLCLARPELLERRPAWSAPQPRRSIVALEPLERSDAVELARGLGAAAADAAAIAQRAEGNPLFVAQLVAVDAEPEALPVSIQATLAARLDALAPEARVLLQRASIEGRTFHAGALAVLLPPAMPRVRSLLVELAHKGLVAGDAPQHPGEDAYRFSHALIRDVAYASVPKRQRAELHTALADWLEDRPRAADEVIAHHLETACRLLAEAGDAGPDGRALAARAVPRLRAAARAALARGDPAAASALLERAVALAGPDAHARAPLLPALGAALFEAGRLTEAAHVLDAAVAAAPDPRLDARARVERAFVRLEAEHEAGTQDAGRTAERALAALAGAGDEEGEARAWSLRAQAAWTAGRVAEADAAWAQAAERARAAGDERELHAILGWRATAAVLGPTPVDEALPRCAAFRDAVAASPAAVASMVNPMGSLHAMRGEFSLAQRAIDEANATLRDLGTLGAAVSHHEALVWLLADRPERAERPLRAGIEVLRAMDDGALLATTTAMLAQAVLAQGRTAEADELCRATAATAAPDDIVTQAIRRSVQARVRSAEGACEEAVVLAREAVALLAPTDLLSHRADAMLDLGEVLGRCSGEDEPIRVFRAALSLYEQKGNAVGARRARALLSRRTRET